MTDLVSYWYVNQAGGIEPPTNHPVPYGATPPSVGDLITFEAVSDDSFKILERHCVVGSEAGTPNLHWYLEVEKIGER